MAVFNPISTTLNPSVVLVPGSHSKFKPLFSSINYGKPKFCCFAAKAKQKNGPPVKKQPPPPPPQPQSPYAANKKREKKIGHTTTTTTSSTKNNKGFDGFEGHGSSLSLPLPKPPAGFVVDDQGRVLMVSNKRIATIVDSVNNLPLECVIRRVFRSSRGEECMLLCPVDTPIQILKSTSFDEWLPVSDEETEAILPAAAYALAKIHMHLVHSGFSYTARGGFSYTEEDIFEYLIDDDVVGSSTNEGVEITCFHLDGTNYMLYTPVDPMLFVAVKDKNGKLQIADDDLLEDHTIISAIDEETEFNALVEEEAALIESLLGQG